MLKNSLKILSVGFLVMLIGGMNSANGSEIGADQKQTGDEESFIDSTTSAVTVKRRGSTTRSTTSSSDTMGGITLENVEKKLLGKIDRKKGGLQYARSLFSGVDPVTTPNGYADFDEPTQSKIRNTVIIVAVYGDSSSFKGLASDMQSPSESRAITLGLCHFLRKTAPTITMLELSFKDDQGDFKIEECLDGSLRGINQISFFMKQAAKGFSARFCHLNTKSREAGSAVPRPTDLITVFNDAAMLALPTSGPCPESDLTLRRVASLTATSPGHNDIKSSLLANQYGAGGSESRIFSHVDANGSDEENGDKKNKEPTCPCIIM